ncbi:hypothetical protein [Komagataeibacter saccharivorans]|uniref:hypothetical protein n=1 Tax=Komagataeibacter saccharivorans TaxID=265959 RepID=UPI0015E8E948|nr:hypothetical protein [Komagataeibacter saccharivorans]GBQ40086.1 hypothetical protein AA0614_1871 [Komagataeibacter saccharivorans NRIC 0614]
MPSIHAMTAGVLTAGLCAAAVTAPCAHARSHHFSVREHHIHGNSPYGYISGYEPVLPRENPRYAAAEQKCEATSATGAIFSGTGGSSQISAGGSNHKKFFAQCMVEEGVWKARYDNNVGGIVSP